jgi:hydroxymethylglutaryl-CoA reductase
MNGVDAVVIATGNDWRAIEAGACVGHSGRYTSLNVGKSSGGNLAGSLEMPVAVGIVGGTTKVHPMAKSHSLMGAYGGGVGADHRVGRPA